VDDELSRSAELDYIDMSLEEVNCRTPRCVDADDRMIVMSEGEVKIMMSSAG
jgi:hypothetical protein